VVFLFRARKINNLNLRQTRFNMLSEEQVKKLISANESLQVQLADANAMLAAREKEIEYLGRELAESTALRSKLDSQLGEIQSIQDKLQNKEQAVKGAEERELELQLDLTELARLNRKYAELLQDYAYLSSQLEDSQSQLAIVKELNFQLEQKAGRIGELESRLEIALTERNDLKNRVTTLESQKLLKDINL
jgi:DNA repair exonuclease SbcCD ATPase subunit